MSILTNPAYLDAAAIVRQKATEFLDSFGLDDDNLPALRLTLAQELGYPVREAALWALLDLMDEARRIGDDVVRLGVPVNDPDYPAAKADRLHMMDDLISEGIVQLIAHQYLVHKAAA